MYKNKLNPWFFFCLTLLINAITYTFLFKNKTYIENIITWALIISGIITLIRNDLIILEEIKEIKDNENN
jgi:hypothetical protein